MPSDSTPSRPQCEPLSFRSGTVARIAAMPVSTLRIWEQRYQAVAPRTASSGHRLYSSTDVERVLLLRELTLSGHSISVLARVPVEQLKQLGQTRSNGAGLPFPVMRSKGRVPLRVMVIGSGMGERLRRPGVRRRLVYPLQVVRVFDSLSDAAPSAGESVDLVLWHVASLQPDSQDQLAAVQSACGHG